MEWIERIATAAISGGFFVFLQFLIQRKDNKTEESNSFREEFSKGLQEREQTGKARYEEHKESIRKLEDAILQLTKNDADMAEYMKYMGAELMGLAHDKLVWFTDKIAARNAITLKEKATLEAIYRPYHDGLNGNGDGQTGYEYCMGLKVVSEKIAKELDEKGESYHEQ